MNVEMACVSLVGSGIGLVLTLAGFDVSPLCLYLPSSIYPLPGGEITGSIMGIWGKKYTI